MPAVKVREDELLDRLTEVFRIYGYEGASLSIISQATGLQRASLYHRFPGGKEDMAKAVLEHARQWLTNRVLAPLSRPGTPEQRIRNMVKELHAFYAGGKRSCLLDSLSLGFEENPIKRHVREGMEAWAEALAKIARETGVNPQKARQRALDAISRIQGSLVVARVMKDCSAFERTLLTIPQVIMGKA